MQCRAECGACCIVPAIHHPFWLMPNGKAAGERCVHLDKSYRCKIFNDPRRPVCCDEFKAEADICGQTQVEAIKCLWQLEIETNPNE